MVFSPVGFGIQVENLYSGFRDSPDYPWSIPFRIHNTKKAERFIRGIS
jgi:hypothetical protein